MNLSNIIAVAQGRCIYNKVEIPADYVEQVLTAALYAIKGKPGCTCELYVTDKRLDMERLADACEHGRGESIKEAPLLIAVVADAVRDTDLEEHSASVVSTICSQAAALGLAACPVMIRGHYLTDGEKCEDAVRGILDIQEGEAVYAVIGLGYADTSVDACSDEDLEWDRIHIKE